MSFCLPTTAKAIVAQAQRLGAAGRIAYDVGGGLVVKIQGEEDNLIEADIWRAVEAHPSLARYFAPVHACGEFGEWQLMKRLTNAREDGRWDYCPQVADAARKAFSALGWKAFLSDLHAGNWGRDEDGAMRILDYAYCCLVDPEGNVYGNRQLLRHIEGSEQ